MRKRRRRLVVVVVVVVVSGFVMPRASNELQVLNSF